MTMDVDLDFVPPYDWPSMIAFLAVRAIPGVEAIESDVYRRSIEIDGVAAGFEVRHVAAESRLHLRVEATFPIERVRIVGRIRRLFDLDCDPRQIARHFERDKRLGILVRTRPGLRLPGAWDSYEMAVRSILGQHVSVRAASSLAGRLVQAFGVPAAVGLRGVTHRFPAAARLADADIRKIGIPEARAHAIRSLARVIADGSLVLDGSQDLDATIARLSTLPGVGPWTVQYIAMRALGELDAWPAEDLGLKKALARNGRALSRREIIRQAEPWRPFRAYAVMHLWRSLAEDQ